MEQKFESKLAIRLAEDAKEFIYDHVKRNNLTMSAYVRRLIFLDRHNHQGDWTKHK